MKKPPPMKIDFSQAITAEARAAEQGRAAAQAEARALLAQTDWYLVRKIETGAAVPRAILDARKAARDVLSGDEL
jgi:hypothetical protein